MIRFKDKKTNKIKNAYDIKYTSDKAIVQFTENGKTYSYSKDNIEIITNEDYQDFLVYKLKRTCYNCKKETIIYTYIKYDNLEDLTYPWDKNRLNKEKSQEEDFLHLEHPEIEWYPIQVIGSSEELDNIMLKKFPNNIKKQYSSTQNRTYPMNVCCNCGAKQGEFFIYQEINKKITNMEKLEIYEENNLTNH
jgi:hypothetical protein